MMQVFHLILFATLFSWIKAGVQTCGTSCSRDIECIQNAPLSPCSFCSNGVCISLCGIGCRSSMDCQNGGTNPCLYCNPATRTCVNPNPLCGSYCPNNVACLINGTENSKCPTCDIRTNSCYPSGNTSLCGKVCSGEFQCSGDPKCSQCVGFYCAKPASCGQVCVSSGQCQMNPGQCKACIGAVCQNLIPCGGACGNDSWCSSRCPVCGWPAKCTSRLEWENQLKENEGRLEEFLNEAELARKEVRTYHDQLSLAKFKRAHKKLM